MASNSAATEKDVYGRMAACAGLSQKRRAFWARLPRPHQR